MDIELAWETIASGTLKYVEEPGTRPLIFNTFTGSGKTRNVLEAVDRAGKQWIYVAPYHDTIEENVKFRSGYDFNYTHLLSRSKVCHIPRYRMLMNEYNIDIRPYCQVCMKRKNGTCTYYQRKEEMETYRKNLACVHSHMFTDIFTKFLPDNQYTYDVLIIDETPVGSMFENASITIKDLQSLVSSMNMVPMSAHYRAPMNQIVSIIRDALMDENADIQHSRFPNGNPEFYSALYHDYSNAVLSLLSQNPNMRMRIPRFVQVLLNTISTYISDISMLRAAIFKTSYHGETKVNVNKFIGALPTYPMKIIGLDATATRDTWEFFLGRQVDMVDLKYPVANVVMAYGGPTWQNSWLSYHNPHVISDRGKWMANVVVEIAKNAEKNVIACRTSKVWRVLRNYIEKGLKNKAILKKIDFAKYYYLRGKNEFYKNANDVILLHAPRPPPQQVESMATLTGQDVAFWEDISTKDEMAQAMGRVRFATTEIAGVPRGDVFVWMLFGPTADFYANNDHLIFNHAEVVEMLREGKLKMFKRNDYINYAKGNVPFMLDILPATVNEISEQTGMRTSEVISDLDAYRWRGIVTRDNGVWSRRSGTD